MLISQKGQGLIETVVTLLIIAGAAIALLRFQSYLAYSNEVTQQQNDAITLALNQIETLRDFSALSGGSSYANITSSTSTANGLSTTYNLSWTITTNTNPNSKVIDVTVSWTDRFGNAQSMELTSQVAGIDPSFSGTIM